MRITTGSGLLIFLALLGLFGIIQSLTFKLSHAIALPLAMSSLIFVLAVIGLIGELRTRDTTKSKADAGTQATQKAAVESRRFGWALSWVLGLFLGVYLLGFTIAIFVFTLAYLKWRGRAWPVAVIFAIGTSAVIYGIFELGLRSQLYPGLVFGG